MIIESALRVPPKPLILDEKVPLISKDRINEIYGGAGSNPADVDIFQKKFKIRTSGISFNFKTWLIPQKTFIQIQSSPGLEDSSHFKNQPPENSSAQKYITSITISIGTSICNNGIFSSNKSQIICAIGAGEGAALIYDGFYYRAPCSIECSPFGNCIFYSNGNSSNVKDLILTFKIGDQNCSDVKFNDNYFKFLECAIAEGEGTKDVIISSESRLLIESSDLINSKSGTINIICYFGNTTSLLSIKIGESQCKNIKVFNETTLKCDIG
ncbi:hypothetical protein ACTFIY_010071 [Dictyostelium cf. discoideum]